MGSAGKIIRTALHAFFWHYHPLSSAASLLALPFFAAALLSRSHPALLTPCHALSRRLRNVLVTAGFPPASQLLFLLSHHLSQRACAFVSVLPFSLSFLLLAKAYTVHFGCPASLLPRRRRRAPAASSAGVVLREAVRPSYLAMARTEVVNCLALLLANAAVFAALHLLGDLSSSSASISISIADAGGRAVLALSSAGVIVYSVALAKASAPATPPPPSPRRCRPASPRPPSRRCSSSGWYGCTRPAAAG
jgi:hypothetical protein